MRIRMLLIGAAAIVLPVASQTFFSDSNAPGKAAAQQLLANEHLDYVDVPDPRRIGKRETFKDGDSLDDIEFKGHRSIGKRASGLEGKNRKKRYTDGDSLDALEFNRSIGKRASGLEGKNRKKRYTDGDSLDDLEFKGHRGIGKRASGLEGKNRKKRYTDGDSLDDLEFKGHRSIGKRDTGLEGRNKKRRSVESHERLRKRASGLEGVNRKRRAIRAKRQRFFTKDNAPKSRKNEQPQYSVESNQYVAYEGKNRKKRDVEAHSDDLGFKKIGKRATGLEGRNRKKRHIKAKREVGNIIAPLPVVLRKKASAGKVSTH